MHGYYHPFLSLESPFSHPFLSCLYSFSVSIDFAMCIPWHVVSCVRSNSDPLTLNLASRVLRSIVKYRFGRLLRDCIVL
jgi:hypothetical protein